MNNDFDVENNIAIQKLLTPKDRQSEILSKQDEVIFELKTQTQIAIKNAEDASIEAKTAKRQSTIANIISAISLLVTFASLIVSIK